MKIRLIKQRDGRACGPACIKMTVDYFKLPISFSEIEKASQYKKKDGLSNKDLVNTLKKFGLETKEVSNADWADLLRHNTPKNVIIVSWMLRGYIGHFSVVDKITKSTIYLADPEKGKIVKLPKRVFMRLWFDYDEMWYPKKNTDIQLRWMAMVSKKIAPRTKLDK